MKKRLKQGFALLISLMLIIPATAGVFADGTSTRSVTINGTDGDRYRIYQVMTATLIGTSDQGNAYRYEVSSDFAGFFNGNPYSLDERSQILKKNGEPVSTDGMANIQSSEAAQLAVSLSNYARENNVSGASVSAQDSVDLAEGYYLIVQTETEDPAAGSLTAEVASKPMLLDLTDENRAITPKTETVDLSKVILENGSEVKENQAKIGDTVPYQVTTCFPLYEYDVQSRFETVSPVFRLTDSFSEGLTYDPASLEVTIGNAAAVSPRDYTTSYENGVLVILFSKSAILENQGERVTAHYAAVLNTGAKIDALQGNPNTVRLDYTHNPNEENAVKTLTDDVRTYTYGFRIHKTDLKSETADMSGTVFKVWLDEAKTRPLMMKNSSGDEEAVMLTIGDGNTAELRGITEGDYYLEETTAKTGYAMLSGVTGVRISAGRSGGNLDGTASISLLTGSGFSLIETDEDSNHDDQTDLTVKIVNEKGIHLPQTGGLSARYLMDAGLLVTLIGLATVFIRRKNKEER